MSKTENFTVRLGGDLKRRMKDRPEINWSHLIREHVRAVLDDLDRLDRLADDSQLTHSTIEELAAAIDAAAAERAAADLAGDGEPEAEPTADG